jgi:hypothetical protein
MQLTLNRTVWLTLWRTKDHEHWNEAGAHATLEQAASAATKLRETGLQAVPMEWREADLAVVSETKAQS